MPFNEDTNIRYMPLGPTGWQRWLDYAAQYIDPTNPELLCDLKANRLNGFNGWATPSGKIIHTSTTGAEDLHLRGWYNSTLSSEPLVATDQAYTGTYSFKCVSADPDVNDNGRSQINLLEPRLGTGFLKHNTEYWLSFVIYDEGTSFPVSGQTFEQYMQVHASGSAKSGYGSVASPAISITRQSDTVGRVEIRSNAPGSVANQDIYTFTWSAGAWQRFVMQFKMVSYDDDPNGSGYCRLWRGTGTNDDLTNVVDVSGMIIGHEWSDHTLKDAHFNSYGIYHDDFAVTGARTTHLDLIRLSKDSVRCRSTNMDPLNLDTPNYWAPRS